MSASLLKQLQEKLVIGSRYVAKNGAQIYKQTLENNKHYIDKEPTVEKCQELSKQLFYTRLASWGRDERGFTSTEDEESSGQVAVTNQILPNFILLLIPFLPHCTSLPHRYEAFWKEIDALKKKAMARQDLKLEEVGVAALFSLECYALFCVGEIIGRGTLTGYYP